MALMQRYLRSQFLFSTIGQPVYIGGTNAIVSPAKATLVNQGVTLTALVAGSAGNSITYAVTGGGTAGAEVVTVVGSAISIQIESGVSTVTQVRTALNAFPAASLLILATGTSAVAVTAPVSVTPLAGGTDGSVTNDCGNLVTSIVRSGVGQYTLTLANNYNAAQFVAFKLVLAAPANLIPQLQSVDVVNTKQIVVNLLNSATKTDLTTSGSLIFTSILNNSSIR